MSGHGLRLVPVFQKAAKAWVTDVHRHLDPPPGDLFRVGVARDGALVGVAMSGRPVAPALQDGVTVEVLRVAVLEGNPNACSMLYGASRRAALALGYVRGVTYTLPEEGGASLRAAGWRFDGTTDGGEWDRKKRPRRKATRPDIKSRWVWP